MTIVVRLALAAFTATAAFAWLPPASSRARAVTSPLFSTTSPSSAASVLSPEFAAGLVMIEKELKPVLSQYGKDAFLPALLHFATEYLTANQNSYEATNRDVNLPTPTVQRFLNAIRQGFQTGLGPDKFLFAPHHKAWYGNDGKNEFGNEGTYDYYTFGMEFFDSVIDADKTTVLGKENIEKAIEQVKNGDNVIFFSNHQSEADPQMISRCWRNLGLEQYAADINYVAGHKVTSDPLAIPFSMGRNLICIHSKKHIDADPETKPIKQKENLQAMSAMTELLKRGGCLLWVAPSGGRDRRNTETGHVPLAPFDSKTMDMFRLLATKSKKPTHYYPMALVTYELCPPPDTIDPGVGEVRNFRFVPVGNAVGEEIVMEGALDSRKEFNNEVYKRCFQDYVTLRQIMFPDTVPDEDE